MKTLVAIWNSIKGNPIFVTAWTLFAGALGSELTTAWTSGKFDFSLQSWQKMGEAAAVTTAIALIHLYITPKNATVQATFPPSQTVVSVPATLEPVDPKAVPTTPKE